MIISNLSWHYRFNKFVQGNAFVDRALSGRFTTCSYIRTLIFSVISGATKAVVTFVLGILAATFVLSGLIVPILIWFTDIQPAEPFGPFALVFWGIVAFCLLFAFCKYTKDRIKRINWDRKPKEPNLFIQAIKDKHDKFCTRVKVVVK